MNNEEARQASINLTMTRLDYLVPIVAERGKETKSIEATRDILGILKDSDQTKVFNAITVLIMLSVHEPAKASMLLDKVIESANYLISLPSDGAANAG